MEKKFDLKKYKPLGIFYMKILGSYFIWVFIRELFYNVPFLQQIWSSINNFLAQLYVKVSSFILKTVFKIPLHHDTRNIFIDDTQGLYVGDHCLGISATVIYSLIILFLGGSKQQKLRQVSLGIITIFAINVFRIVGLGIMLKNSSPAFFKFNHSYTYLILVYGIILFLVVRYEKKISL